MPGSEPGERMGFSVFKPWRSHVELDGLSDGECRVLLEREWVRNTPPFRAMKTFAASVGFVWAIGTVVFASVGLDVDLADPLAESFWTQAGLLGSVVGGGVLSGPIVWLLLRDVTMRSTLRRLILGGRCPRCGHSLIGLPVFDDAAKPEDFSRRRVRCTECGKLIFLQRHGMTPRDLAPWEERVLPKDFEVRVRR